MRVRLTSIVFPVFLRRFALVVGGGFFGGFLATGQQAVDEGLAYPVG